MSEELALKYLFNHLNDESDAVFPHALLLNSLANTGRFGLKIREILFTKLLDQRGLLSTYNYWFEESPMNVVERYPNDLDDTCCAWIALIKQRPSLMDKKTFFELLKVFSFCYDKNNGGYRTWIVKKEERLWQNFDLGVNINVLRFLSNYGFRPKKAYEILDLSVILGKLNSVFYCGDLPLIYFLSDFYRGKGLISLRKRITYLMEIKKNDPALVLVGIAALRFGFVDLITKKLVKSIQSFQRVDGSYPIFPFYYYQYKNSETNYYQGDLMSTGFYIEFKNLLKELSIKIGDKEKKDILTNQIKTSLACVHQVDLEAELLNRVKRLMRSDSNELLIFLADRLCGDLNQVNLSVVDLNFLAIVQTFANVAYEIYDDINDEQKNLDALPIANIALYVLFKQIDLFPKSSLCRKNLLDCFITLEKNFYFEKKKLSFNKLMWIKLKNLSEIELFKITLEKAKATGFSSYLLLDLSKIKDAKIIKKIIFLIYLIKQFNDDFHDCFVDLKNHKFNLVNYYLLNKISKFDNKNELFEDDLYLRKIFYDEVISMVQNKIFKCIQRAQNLLLNQSAIKQNGFFRKILYDYEKLFVKGVRRADLIRYLLHKSIKNGNENFITCT
jgi:hypothetical protein